MDGAEVIRIGAFALNRARGCLEDAAGAERFLRPKSYRVLELLAERRGTLVSKDVLIRAAWPDVIVSDDSLAHCISDIRRALGPESAKLLRTVPRRGYMLAAEIDARQEQAASAGRRRWRGQAAGVGAALALAAALWWALPTNTKTTVPLEVGLAVARADQLLEARDWRRREDNEQARTLLQSVVAAEPGNAAALASLGLTYWLEVQHLAWGGGRREMAEALDLVERSVALGGSARSHRLLAEMRLLAPFAEMRSTIDARASARAAVALDPDDPDNLAVLAQVLALTGRAGEAVPLIERARRIRPAPPDWYRGIAGLAYLLSGAPARAAEEFGPLYGAGTFATSRWWPGWLLTASLAHAGRVGEAAGIVGAARKRWPQESITGVAESLDGFADPDGLAFVLDGLRRAGMSG